MEKDSSQIRREIENTRERLGDTVEALAYKADIPSRAKDAVHDRVDSAKDSLSDVVDAAATTLGHAAHSVQAKVADFVDTVRPQHASEQRAVPLDREC